ncbi:zinc-dependent metalloprotease [Myxococcus sp. K38C18041901]|uniref:M12 family metallo-peptidase n=1 Tax=Myxococcus guangdongensis TaxID=2906760 RepID=UPI0020A82204|nr:M12 family metallo-peptidase [Myxococcus guangdongensis]MCP3060114.1 zinc-dependent metalloprotease [Myxococcus guangdongensis]
MGCCFGRTRAQRLRPIEVEDEQPPLEQPWVTEEWETRTMWTLDERADAENVFDILAVFTSDGAFMESDDRIDQDQLLQNIHDCIQEMNEAFLHSGITVRGRLVAIERFSPPPPFITTSMYRDALLGEPENQEERRRRRQEPIPTDMDTYYGTIRNTYLTLRERYRPHVLLFVSGNIGDPISGGIGVTNWDESIAVVPAAKLLDEHAPAHEVGHLFGCEHNREAVIVRTGASCYGYIADHWRTIMAYNTTSPQRRVPIIGRFSNPDVTYDDGEHPPHVTGDAGANNAAQINTFAPTILGIRD